MDQITNWIQSNWYELGSLTAQFTFLFAGLWFAAKILRTMRATQQQMGALLRLSMTDGLEERTKMSETGHETMNEATHEPSPSVVTGSLLGPVMERPTSYSAFEKPARTERPSLCSELSEGTKSTTPIAGALIAEAPLMSSQEATSYVAAPLTLPEDEHNDGHLAAAGRGVVQWLQTPMTNKRKGGSPLKKVVRWLQAPVR